MLDLCPALRRAFFVFHSWGGAPNPPYFFSLQKRPCGPHLAGRTLQAAPCGSLLQKASTPNCRPQDKFIFIRAFYNVFSGVAPQTRLTFFIAKKTLRAAFAKRLAPRAAVRRTNLFLYGHFTTFFSGVAPLTCLTFFHCKKSKQKS